MKLPMTVEEIVKDYLSAKYRPLQIKILADLNVTTQSVIKKILVEQGVLEEKPKKPSKARSPDRVFHFHEEAMELYRKGLSDREIGEIIHRHQQTVWEWRKVNGLEPNKPKPKVKENPMQEDKKTQVSDKCLSDDTLMRIQTLKNTIRKTDSDRVKGIYLDLFCALMMQDAQK